MAAREGYIILSGNEFNIAWLKSVSESYALQCLVKGGFDKDQVINAWKQANGKTVRNPRKPKPPDITKEPVEKANKKSQKEPSSE